ncbi:sugar transferase [Algoriphagus namhaensis]
MPYQKFWKRILDLFIASVMFLVLSPLFVLLCLILSLYHQGSPFFSQARPGLHGKSFQILKFKTMSDLRDERGDLLADQFRLGKLGKLIRKASLDEIPQLLNVLQGDMSMVGPRPLLPEYLDLYSSEEARRHEIRPGITGWAQINGRNAITWERKFELDVWYVDHVSFLLDWEILFKTLFNVLSGKGVTQQGHVSVGKFYRPKASTDHLEMKEV